ncbi:hypothetical protein [Pasteurella multocida]|uniref:hypothetical protein n=1 Tax=Pasteurella multocida TaxID=747 RepID=UPI001F5361E5|nr:hypothetical protein [Pasteurella multocida]
MGLLAVMVFILIVASLAWMTFDEVVVSALCLCIAFCLLGWIFAKVDVAEDCEKVSKFYVDSVVYECTAVKEEKND